MKVQRLRLFILAIVALMVGGCAAAQIALEHKDLVVQTQMSETVFLEPVSPEKKSIWIEVKNTSDKSIELSNLQGLIAQRGYQINSNPSKVPYRLQVNILSVGMCSPSALNQSIYAGWGGAMTGGLAGAAIGIESDKPFTGGVIGGLIGGATELIAGSLVKNVTYGIITDVQISENKAGNWRIYRTRVASSANKVNLTFEEALPAIINGLEKSLAGIF